MKIALYGIMEDIRARKLKCMDSVPIHARKLVLYRIIHILHSS